MRDTTSAVKKHIGRCVAVRTVSSVFDTFIQAVFVQLLLEASFHVRMRSRDSEGLSRMVGHSNEKNTLSFSTEKGAGGF